MVELSNTWKVGWGVQRHHRMHALKNSRSRWMVGHKGLSRKKSVRGTKGLRVEGGKNRGGAKSGLPNVGGKREQRKKLL